VCACICVCVRERERKREREREREREWVMSCVALALACCRYFCPAGSSNNTVSACGNATVYCPAGSGLPVSVSSGHYSVPVSGALTNRTGQLPCPAGSYCTAGVMADCPAGRYGDSTALNSSACTASCPAGRFGSTAGESRPSCAGHCSAGCVTASVCALSRQ
jgi:hypothetical protein